jgi:hypothetical protein
MLVLKVIGLSLGVIGVAALWYLVLRLAVMLFRRASPPADSRKAESTLGSRADSQSCMQERERLLDDFLVAAEDWKLWECKQPQSAAEAEKMDLAWQHYISSFDSYCAAGTRIDPATEQEVLRVWRGASPRSWYNRPELARRRNRIRARLPITLLIESQDQKISYKTSTIDFSPLGIRVQAKIHLRPGQCASVIPGDHPGESIRTIVVWVGPEGSALEGEVGLRFLDHLPSATETEPPKVQPVENRAG